MSSQYKDKLRASLRVIAATVCFLIIASCESESVESVGYQPVVDELVTLLESEPELQAAVDEAIENAGLTDIPDLNAFLMYLDELVTYVPTEREVVPRALKFYYIVNQAPDDQLNESETFNAWMHRLVEVWGEFLDTPASAAGIETFISSPSYRIEDYFAGPSGWQTFNQFFAREVKPGKRPIAESRDDTVIVSPADAVFMGQWPIDADSNITVKGANWAIAELLDGSPYADQFRNGIYAHSFLYIDDYHRYHVPVGGVVKEVRNIHGKVYMEVYRQPDGTLDVVDGDTYQFNQERGLVVIDSPAWPTCLPST